MARAIFSDLPDWRPARPDNAVSLPEGSVDLWFAPLAASGPSDDDVLSEPERQRALAMRESTLRRHFIAARVLVAPPMSTQVQLLTPARGAWTLVASTGFA
ncbi:MAG: hypothetical protein EBR51_09155, partial [Gammaproteobacteria bacterium]|nr:hypothetical protein [Gammaproteobacteria bacterium]